MQQIIATPKPTTLNTIALVGAVTTEHPPCHINARVMDLLTLKI